MPLLRGADEIRRRRHDPGAVGQSIVPAAEADLDAKVQGGLKITLVMEEIFKSGKIKEID